jgi:hypothetical protein
MEEEFDALVANNTWDIIPWPANSNSDGNLERYKARWVL